MANLQKNNDPTLNEEVRKAIGMDSNFTSIQEKVKLTIKSIEKQGINNPTKITSNAFITKNKANSFDDIYNLIGIGTHISQKNKLNLFIIKI